VKGHDRGTGHREQHELGEEVSIGNWRGIIKSRSVEADTVCTGPGLSEQASSVDVVG